MFDPKQASALTRDDVIEELSGVDELYAHFPEDDEPDDGSDGDSCEAKRANESSKVSVVGAKSDGILFEARRGNDRLCPGETKASNEAVMLQRCVGGDFSALRGKSTAEVTKFLEDDEKVCSEAEAVEQFFNLRSAAAGSGNGFTYEFSLLEATVGAGDGSTACRWVRKDSKFVLETDCVVASARVSSSEYQGSVSETKTYRRLTLKAGLSSLAGSKDPWFSSGTVEVVLNNWTGTLTYSGATTAPQLKLTTSQGDGGQATTIDEPLKAATLR